MTIQLQQLAAWVAAIVFALMAGFQLLLAFGLPWGHLAWGGEYRILPAKFRFASFLATMLFSFGITAVLERAHIEYFFNRPDVIAIVVWAYAGLFALSTIGNLLSTSTFERRVMTPVAIILVITCVIVAIGP